MAWPAVTKDELPEFVREMLPRLFAVEMRWEEDERCPGLACGESSNVSAVGRESKDADAVCFEERRQLTAGGVAHLPVGPQGLGGVLGVELWP